MHRFSVADKALLRKLLALLLAAALIIGSAVFAFANEAPAAGSGSSEESSRELSQEEIEKRKEIYTIGAMIALGAIIVGIREKRNRR